jgi:hypothetical protein
VPRPSVHSVGTWTNGTLSPGSPPSVGARLVFIDIAVGGDASPASVTYGGLSLTLDAEADSTSSTTTLQIWSVDSTGHSGTALTPSNSAGTWGLRNWAWVENADVVVTAKAETYSHGDGGTMAPSPAVDMVDPTIDSSPDELGFCVVHQESEANLGTTEGNWTREDSGTNGLGAAIHSTGTSTGSCPFSSSYFSTVWSDGSFQAAGVVFEESAAASPQDVTHGLTEATTASAKALTQAAAAAQSVAHGLNEAGAALAASLSQAAAAGQSVAHGLTEATTPAAKALTQATTGAQDLSHGLNEAGAALAASLSQAAAAGQSVAHGLTEATTPAAKALTQATTGQVVAHGLTEAGAALAASLSQAAAAGQSVAHGLTEATTPAAKALTQATTGAQDLSHAVTETAEDLAHALDQGFVGQVLTQALGEAVTSPAKVLAQSPATGQSLAQGLVEVVAPSGKLLILGAPFVVTRYAELRGRPDVELRARADIPLVDRSAAFVAIFRR